MSMCSAITVFKRKRSSGLKENVGNLMKRKNVFVILKRNGKKMRFALIVC